jgi:protein arginine kinase
MTLPRRPSARASRRAAIPDEKLGRVVVSSRIRLARNLADAPFPDWAPPEQLKAVFERVVDAVGEAGEEVGMNLKYATVEEDTDFAESLYESHLVSRDLLDRGAGAGYFLDVDTMFKGHSRFSMMVNEEDHIRIQVIRDDERLDEAWAVADRFDTALSHHLPYAFSKKLGYLTACPSNLGTGLRASVMLALPALVLIDEFESTCRAVDRLGYNARGVNGENSSTSSCLVQISNRGTLGFSETDVIARLKKVVDEVIRVELQARRYSMTKGAVFLDDMVARSLSLLQFAYILQAEEALNALTAVRLGVELGMVRHLRISEVESLEAACGHYAILGDLIADGCTAEEADDPDVRDQFRASMVRRAVARATLHPFSDNLS